jgi:hypothetical protein
MQFRIADTFTDSLARRTGAEQKAVNTAAFDLRSPPALFAALDDDALLGYGVPPEWLAEVCAVDEDGLLALADHLPQEAAEARTTLDLPIADAPSWS